MPAFTFIGDPRHSGEGPEQVTLFGFTFGRSTATEVIDATVARKLATNPHFARAEVAARPQPPAHKRKARRRAGAPAPATA